MASTDDIAELKAIVQALVGEIKAMKEAAANAVGPQGTPAKGHTDARVLMADGTISRHPLGNSEQVLMTGRELEDMVLAHDAALKAIGRQAKASTTTATKGAGP